MKRLGINIDHVATIRNARGENHPNPLKAAILAMKCGADSITIHLREDRRHIKDLDLILICKNKNIPVNLEMALDNKILKLALKSKPQFICIVPENRNEVTTEGGLNLKINQIKIKKVLDTLKKNKIRTSLFINPSIKDIKLSKILGTDCVELHTGKISNLIKKKKNYTTQFKKLKECAIYADKLGLDVHAGHGMNYTVTKILNKIDEIKEFNIGHFIIGESIFYGLNKAIKKIKNFTKK